MLVAEAVGRALARRGPRHVFGLIGSGNFAVTNAMVAAGATFVAARHEGGAISMADAYAQVTGRFAWEQGDVLLLDNMLTAHGRRPYSGARQVVVAMSDLFRP